MEVIKNVNPESIIEALQSAGLVLVNKTDLEELLLKINLENRVDHRCKYISHREVISMFGVTDYWLKRQREQAETKIVSIPGEFCNSAWKYKQQSIQEELDRLAL